MTPVPPRISPSGRPTPSSAMESPTSCSSTVSVTPMEDAWAWRMRLVSASCKMRKARARDLRGDRPLRRRVRGAARERRALAGARDQPLRADEVADGHGDDGAEHHVAHRRAQERAREVGRVEEEEARYRGFPGPGGNHGVPPAGRTGDEEPARSMRPKCSACAETKGPWYRYGTSTLPHTILAIPTIRPAPPGSSMGSRGVSAAGARQRHRPGPGPRRPRSPRRRRWPASGRRSAADTAKRKGRPGLRLNRPIFRHFSVGAIGFEPTTPTVSR